MYQEIFRIPFIDRPCLWLWPDAGHWLYAGGPACQIPGPAMGYNGDTFINACLLALVTGVVGARLSHVLESLAADNHEFSE